MTYDKNTIVFEPLPTHFNFKNVIGQVYGRLTVIGFAGRVGRRTSWYCECKCGNIKIAVASYLQSGNTTSCGCRQIETWTTDKITHGMRHTSEYTAYHHAKDRCNNPNDKRWDDYGGRGIEFRFESFEEFFAEVGLRPEGKTKIDRIEVNGHYEKGNLRWVDDIESARNTRTNRHLTCNGKTQLLIEWAQELGVNPAAILYRLKSGQSEQDALTPPFKGKGIPTKNRLRPTRMKTLTIE